MAITDTEIKRAKPEQKPYSMTDSGGLHLVISPSGGRLWRWKYRFEGREKLMALGKYPQVPRGMKSACLCSGRESKIVLIY
jgi:Arm DNA-binding domain